MLRTKIITETSGFASVKKKKNRGGAPSVAEKNAI